MAAKDVKEYYFKLIAQKAELDADLADFEEALKNGFITEEQMQAAKDELIPYQINLDRLTYIMYLLELPNRKAKKAKFANQNKKILNELEKRKADAETAWETFGEAEEWTTSTLKKHYPRWQLSATAANTQQPKPKSDGNPSGFPIAYRR